MTICEVCGKAAQGVAMDLIDPGLRDRIVQSAVDCYQCDDIQITPDAVVDETDDGDYWVEA